jgi:hypothetical protein
VDETRFDGLARALGNDGEGSRRALLAALAGGLLAAGNAATGAVAVARGGVAGGLLGGRRGKNRRGRANNRGDDRGNNRRKRDRGDGARRGGGAAPATIRLIVENQTTRPIEFTGALRHEVYSDICRTIYREAVLPTLERAFAPDRPDAIVWIDGRFFVDVYAAAANSLPSYFAEMGGVFRADGTSCHVVVPQQPCTEVLGSKLLQVGEVSALRAADACGPGLEIEREADAGIEQVLRIRVIE